MHQRTCVCFACCFSLWVDESCVQVGDGEWRGGWCDACYDAYCRERHDVLDCFFLCAKAEDQGAGLAGVCGDVFVWDVAQPVFLCIRGAVYFADEWMPDRDGYACVRVGSFCCVLASAVLMGKGDGCRVGVLRRCRFDFGVDVRRGSGRQCVWRCALPCFPGFCRFLFCFVRACDPPVSCRDVDEVAFFPFCFDGVACFFSPFMGGAVGEDQSP